MTGATRTVAAFDFDKTLSTRDNVLAFLRSVAGTRRLVTALAIASPLLVAAAIDGRRRDAAKAKVLRALLAGRDASELRASGERFASAVVEHHLRDDVVARLAWHREQGHEIALVSASLATYLEPVGRFLGADAVLATDLAVGADGRLTGGLSGANVRSEEKVRRLEAWIAGSTLANEAVVWAYGDSAGDRELLARADHPVRVGRARLTRAPSASP